MWRYSWLLLFALPPLAIILNHEAISAILIIVWTMLVTPVCIVQALDYFRHNSSNQSALLKNLLRVPIAGLGLLSLTLGACIILWCLYNVFVQRLPEYTGPANKLGLIFSALGVGPGLMRLGWYWMSLALHPPR